MAKYIKFIPFLMLTGVLLFQSCGETPTGNNASETILFDKQGLVDSAWVNCCCTNVQRTITDTLDISAFSKIRISFDGFTNSDGSVVVIYYNTATASNIQLASFSNPDSVNGLHVNEFALPKEKVTLELRTIIFPPVCGANDLKYTRTRNFTITALLLH